MLKSYIRKFFAIVILTTSIFSSAFAGDYQVENQPQVVERVIQFEQKGILKQKENGYLYLEVSRDFISEVLPLIRAPGKILPPRQYTSKNDIGAHISVMYEDEQILNEIWEINELGEEFTFTVKEVRSVKINMDNKVKKLWILAVDAPELERLRESYGLSSFLQGHDFHITIGTQVPGKPKVKIGENVREEVKEAKEAA